MFFDIITTDFVKLHIKCFGSGDSFMEVSREKYSYSYHLTPIF